MKTEIKNLNRDVDAFTLAYIECALWSSTDADGVPLDSAHSWSDLADETLNKMVADCAKFQAQADLTAYPINHAGHDFWFTRNGHGAGFWECVYGTDEQCALLTKQAKAFGECHLYVGDDGKIYL